MQRLAAQLHHHAYRRWRGVPNRHALFCQNAVPRGRIEFGFDDDIGHSMGERGEDSITCSRHPAGVGGAPEPVLRMQIKRIETRDKMRHYRIMDMDGPLRPPGGAAGEMEQRHILGFRRGNIELW